MRLPLAIGAVVVGVPTTFHTPLIGQFCPVRAVVPSAMLFSFLPPYSMSPHQKWLTSVDRENSMSTLGKSTWTQGWRAHLGCSKSDALVVRRSFFPLNLCSNERALTSACFPQLPIDESLLKRDKGIDAQYVLFLRIADTICSIFSSARVFFGILWSFFYCGVFHNLSTRCLCTGCFLRITNHKRNSAFNAFIMTCVWRTLSNSIVRTIELD